MSFDAKQLHTLAGDVLPREIPLDFVLVETGLVGDLLIDVIPNPTNQKYNPVTSTHIPLIQKETVVQSIEKKYLATNTFLPYWQQSSENNETVSGDARIWPREMSCDDLYTISVSRPKKVIDVLKDPFTGEIKEFQEMTTSHKNAKESTSLSRAPSSSKDFVRGSSQNIPFKPGGVDEDDRLMDLLEPPSQKKLQLFAGEELTALEKQERLLSIPPGFSRGIKFDEQTSPSVESTLSKMLVEAPIVVDKNPEGFLTRYEVKAQQSAVQELDLVDRQRQEREQTKRRAKQVLRLDDIFADEENPYGEPTTPASTTQSVATPVVEASKPVTAVLSPTAEAAEEEQPEQQVTSVQPAAKGNDILDQILAADENILLSKFRTPKKKKREWAIMDRIDVSHFNQMVPEMAIKYPFDLDIFQKEAIYHLENNESVFVSAHTSAGKTVVAEYAIALAQKHLTRVIYTSPIKTLSNQKFREFKKTFGDVGILTGDVQINPTATCLIMTTEILRSMLYKGADLIRDVEWVIFDEVHYINDPERGVVWEEVIIMLPKHVNLILLSATIPNTYEFADWIGRTKKKPIYVISTYKRPVPLEHHLYYNGDIYKIVDASSKFLNASYRSAIAAEKQKTSSKAGGAIKSKQGASKTSKSDWVNIISTLQKKKLLPVVVFSFSRAKCEEIAYGLSQTDLSTSKEKNDIHVFIEQSVSRLKGTDRELPQVIRIRELLKRGIGVHHSGLLPIVKEMVEILFSRGLVKVLYATETFAMGVNMPAKTVIFNGLRKHDGRQFRELLPGEYIQMSGRAGRRGLDTVGVVIINCGDEVPEEPVLQKMILGRATKLESQFKLTYNMILNLLRMEEFRVEDMIKRSFSEAEKQKYLPNKELIHNTQVQLSKMETELDCIYGEPDIPNFYSYARELETANSVINQFVMSSKAAFQVLSAGRVMVVHTEKYGYTLGALVKIISAAQSKETSSTSSLLASNDFESNSSEALATKKKQLLVLVLRLKQNAKIPAATVTGLPPFSSLLLPSSFSQGEETDALSEIVEIPEQKIVSICKAKLQGNILGAKSSVGETPSMRVAATQLIELWQANPSEGPEPFNPAVDFKLNALDFADQYKKKQILISKMKESKCLKCPKLSEQYDSMDKKNKLRDKLDKIKFVLSDQNLELMPEYQKRISVLQTLKYIDKEKTVQLKGRVACEVNSCDELIVTEMIFENFFTPLTPEECVAILSCLICEAKSEEQPNLTERLQKAQEKLVELTMGLGQLQSDCGIDTSPQEYKNQLNFSLMEVAYEWAMQKPFVDITQLTTILEGNIVRSIYQIDQACREVRNAARVIGDAALYQKMEAASTLIKRDIIFVSSLYVQQ